MIAVRKILVPVDFSPCSRAALEMSLAVANAFGAAVHVLYVWKPPDSKLSRLVDAAEDEVGAAARRLKSFIAEVPGPKVDVSHRVEIGEPVARILEDAEVGGYDMIVLGTHGRSGRAQLIVGSVAETIVRNASCPVLTVHEKSQAQMPADPPA